MSLKYEQYRSLHITQKFLRAINLGEYGDNKALQEMARCCLRHYPFLSRKGEPLFSQDDFECLDLEDRQ